MLDPRARECPHLYSEWLQSDSTRRVYKAPYEKSFYVVHRYDDVKFVLTNAKLFSSALLPTRHSPFLALMDGSDHLRQREIINKIFQVEQPDFPKTEIQKFISDITDQMVAKKYADMLEEWATLIPLASLGIVFGLPTDRQSLKNLHHHAIVINRALFVLGGTGPRRKATPTFKEKLLISVSLLKNFSRIRQLKKSIGKEGWSELKKMFLPIKTKQENPRPDFSYMPQALQSLLELMLMFSKALEDKSNPSLGIRILRDSINESRLSKTEAIMLCTFILFAGYETSVSLLSNGVWHLAENENLFKKLKQDPGGIELFMEECLRYYTPVGRFLRRANEEVVIGDQTIPKGAMVIVMLNAANTDPERFEEAYSFLEDREKNQHISFGKGIHFCVGAPLARLQAMTAFKVLVDKCDQFILDKTHPLRMVTDRDNGILRLEELWVEIS